MVILIHVFFIFCKEGLRVITPATTQSSLESFPISTWKPRNPNAMGLSKTRRNPIDLLLKLKNCTLPPGTEGL